MHSKTSFFHLAVPIFLFAVFNSFNHAAQHHNTALTGAWKLQENNRTHILIFTDSYFTHTTFNKSNKQFFSSQGGTYGVENNQIETKTEFNTEEKEMVGQSHSYKFLIDTGKLTVDITDING